MTAWLVAWTLFVGCSTDEPRGPTLAEVSETVQFASVDRLGPHHMLATEVRSETRGRTEASPGTPVSRVEETVEIRWQDWDNFEYKRLVDGDIVNATRVVRGHAWVRRARRNWERKDDAEPYRVKLRTRWNAWDQALELFRDRVAYEDLGQEVVEGRPAHKYSLALSPAPPLPPGMTRRRAGEGQPTSLSGVVWVDGATAVRLQADLHGAWRRADVERTVDLRLTRSAIGADQHVVRPGHRRHKKTADAGAALDDAQGAPQSPAPEPTSGSTQPTPQPPNPQPASDASTPPPFSDENQEMPP